MFKLLKCSFIFFVFSFFGANAQQNKSNNVLQNMAKRLVIIEKANEEYVLKTAIAKGWNLVVKNEQGIVVGHLTNIDMFGNPIYTVVDNNLVSATTTSTNLLWNAPYNLNGSSSNMLGKLAVWDEGNPMNIHIEIDNRIEVKDGASVQNHSTHVGGTLIAKGINTQARGMAWGCKKLLSYNFDNHLSEIANEASKLLVSNHSYGIDCGWKKTLGGIWIYYGLLTDTADYKFGWYDSTSHYLDSIAFLAPYYLMVKSAGNNRDKNGPAVGSLFYKNSDTVLLNRPVGISSNEAFDNIPSYGCAKNILTVGAIVGTNANTSIPSNIKMSSFSSWGPTDDGRIKPDLVAAGVAVISASNDSATAYKVNEGTSMAAPNVAGSLFLLQELYSQKYNGNFLKAAALKGLAIHTASEAGDFKGPDYKFGWGLLNAEKAANTIIKTLDKTAKIFDSSLTTNDTLRFKFISNGKESLKATISWTDEAGKPTITNLLNNPALKLTNDIDAKIIYKNAIYLPWCLDPSMPDNAAFKGNNFRDNIEQVEVDSAIVGEEYELQITHKGVLKNGYQNFSVIVTGIDTASYCQPFTTNVGGVKVDSFAFADISINNFTCFAYRNSKSKTAKVEAGKKYPIYIAVNSCNSTNNNKIAKVYIDYNANKKFTDASELVYSGFIFNGNGILKDSITIPDMIEFGATIVLRLVIVETNDANNFTACNGNLKNGFTQDFLVNMQLPKVDVALTNISNPLQNICGNKKQFLSVQIFNNGIDSIKNIPLQAVIKKSNNIIATFFDTCKTTLNSKAKINYTLQTPIEFLNDNSYTIEVTTNNSKDFVAANNTISAQVNFASKSNSIGSSAILCSNIAQLKTFNPQPLDNYIWYASADSTKPIASGSNTIANVVSNKYLLSNGGSINIGEKDNTVSLSGRYQQKGGNYFYYEADYPVLLQSAKLYTGHEGKIKIIAADTLATYSNGSYDYKILASTTIDVIASKPNPQLGDIDGYDAMDKGLYHNINLLLPKGKHVLIVFADSVANVFRNNKVAVKKYPYNNGNLLTLTGNNATLQDSFYYYLYDMQVSTLNCASDFTTVIPTQAAQPTIARTGDSLMCSTALNYQWYLNDNIIATATNQYYKPSTAGNYKVATTDAIGCTTFSSPFIINESKTIFVYPNPANSIVNVLFGENINTNVILSIYDVLGIKYYNKNYSNIVSGFTEKINVNALPQGTYYIRLITDNKTITEKIIISR